MSQRSLFDPKSTTTDDVDRAARVTTDERAWKKERANRSRGKKPVVVPIPDGPCCLHCANWMELDPEKQDRGFCAVLVVTNQRIPAGWKRPEIGKGHVFPIAEARDLRLVAYEPLLTKAGHSCTTGNVCPAEGFRPHHGKDRVAA